MADVTVKLSDGVREVSVEATGEGALEQAEATAVRLFAVAVAEAPPAHRLGFGGWALASDTERDPEE